MIIRLVTNINSRYNKNQLLKTGKQTETKKIKIIKKQ